MRRSRECNAYSLRAYPKVEALSFLERFASPRSDLHQPFSLMDVERYQPIHPVRFVTATSLFDGHDAAINIMRRILQQTGVEVIHLGHNRSVQDIVDTAIQEDA